MPRSRELTHLLPRLIFSRVGFFKAPLKTLDLYGNQIGVEGAKALAAVLDFLNLARRATITADTTHDSPGATANYVADAERCRATLKPNAYLGAMLDDPYFPYGKAPH